MRVQTWQPTPAAVVVKTSFILVSVLPLLSVATCPAGPLLTPQSSPGLGGCRQILLFA